jgi:hypothetical protein
MSLFEFVTVMISMILALCLGQILRSTSLLAKTEKSVVPYLPYTLWSVVLLLSVINHWWSLWDLQSLEWNYASFLYTRLCENPPLKSKMYLSSPGVIDEGIH